MNLEISWHQIYWFVLTKILGPIMFCSVLVFVFNLVSLLHFDTEAWTVICYWNENLASETHENVKRIFLLSVFTTSTTSRVHCSPSDKINKIKWTLLRLRRILLPNAAYWLFCLYLSFRWHCRGWGDPEIGRSVVPTCRYLRKICSRFCCYLCHVSCSVFLKL